MAFLYEVGSFTKTVVAAPLAQQTVTLVNGSLTPKAVILWSAGKTATGFVAGQQFAVGISDGTTDRTVVVAADDAAATSQSGRLGAAKALALLSDGAPTLAAECDVTAFGAGTFALDWTTNDLNATIIHYCVLGGADLTNAIVVENTFGRTTAGTQDYTNVGFQGDFVFLLPLSLTAAGTSANWFGTGIGAAVSSSARWAISAGVEDGVTMNFTAKTRQVTNMCMTGLDAEGDAVTLEADFSAWLSNGFRLNWTDPPGTSTNLFYALVLKGGQYAVGAFNKNADGSPPDAQDVSLAFDPVGVLLGSGGKTAAAGLAADSNLSLGGSDGTRHKGIWGSTKDATISTQADSRTADVASTLNTAGTPTNDSEATVALGTAKFSPTWNPNNAVAVEVCYAAFGSAAAVTPGKPWLYYARQRAA